MAVAQRVVLLPCCAMHTENIHILLGIQSALHTEQISTGIVVRYYLPTEDVV